MSDNAWRDVAAALKLSRREAEILQAMFDCEKESSIAADLGISIHTVHSHIERLYRKLNVTSRVGVVVRVFSEYLTRQLE